MKPAGNSEIIRMSTEQRTVRLRRVAERHEAVAPRHCQHCFCVRWLAVQIHHQDGFGAGSDLCLDLGGVDVVCQGAGLNLARGS